jgi:hypothetical protein
MTVEERQLSCPEVLPQAKRSSKPEGLVLEARRAAPQA